MSGLLYIFLIRGFALGSGGDRCLKHEKQALLKFKVRLLDYGNLVSWTTGEDCCRWRGVECDNQTGQIILLDLRPIFSYFDHEGISWTPMNGEISSSLLDLRYLSYLDLSWNRFTKIPEFIGSLKKLAFLKLSGNRISGTIPYQLGNLSRLLSLDVSNNNNDMTTENHEWLSGLSSLRTLKLSRTNLTKSVTWLQSFKSHPSLSILYLQDCQFPEVDPSSLSHINSSKSLAVLHLTDSIFHPSTLPLLLNMSNKLTDLRLSNDQLKGPIPNSFDNMGSLEHLDLSANQLQGGIPKSLGNLCKLKTLLLNRNKIYDSLPLILEKLSGCAKDPLQILDFSVNQINGSLPDIRRFSFLKELYLDGNKLEGPVPDSFGNLLSLTVLSLAGNKLTGSLPQSIGLMSSLKVFDVSSNSLNGVISEIHLLKLSKLTFLSLSFNSLSLKFSSGWIPPFQLDTINMRSCKLGPSFPSWLQTQRNFSHLDISNSGISDDIPNWFWSLPSNLVFLNLSFKNIKNFTASTRKGSSDATIEYTYLYSDTNWDGNGGTILRSAATYIDYASVVWKGVEQEYGNALRLLKVIDLSCNNLTGEIPGELTSLVELITLNLSKNMLSGIIPKEIGQLKALESLDLSTNRISGEIPLSLADLSYLRLCGLPLNTICPGDEKEQDGTENSNLEDEKWYKASGFYISIGVGFTLGFWGVCGALMLTWPTRPACFQFLNTLVNQLCMTIALNAAKVQRRLRS
ncbi:hypothetical protein CRYUN_Cryun23aG0064000 [Craigia yunnanensis]